MNGIETVILQYGLAGVVVFVFYKLMSDELKELRQAIKELQASVDNLRIVIEKRCH